MTAAREKSSHDARGREPPGAAGFAGLALVTAAVLAFASPLGAQDSWQPTVATAPGGTLNSPVPGHVGLTPPEIDLRFFPSPHSTAPLSRRSPAPSPAWSPIVTGAIPVPPDAAPAGARVPPLGKPGAPSPVRPLKPIVAAAEGGQAAAPKAPAGKPADPKAAGGAESEAAADSVFKKPGPLDALPPTATPAQQYCFNTAEPAADARFAWQAKKIKDMEAELDKRAQQLDAKTQEFKDWLARRDEFSRKAHEKLVGFYARMRPDAAAVQLATVDEEMAAAVVMKLETKVASAIMGEMDPEQAAKIAAIISGAARLPRQRQRQAPPPAAEQASEAAPPAEAPLPTEPRT